MTKKLIHGETFTDEMLRLSGSKKSRRKLAKKLLAKPIDELYADLAKVEKVTKRIPIKEAKGLAKDYNLTHVIIYGFDQNNNVQHVVTYGKSLDQCDQAAKLGNMMKEGLGFPKSLCKSEPSRVQKLLRKIEKLEKTIQFIKDERNSGGTFS